MRQAYHMVTKHNATKSFVSCGKHLTIWHACLVVTWNYYWDMLTINGMWQQHTTQQRCVCHMVTKYHTTRLMVTKYHMTRLFVPYGKNVDGKIYHKNVVRYYHFTIRP